MFKHDKISIQVFLLAALASLILAANVLLFLYYRNTRKEIEKSYISKLASEYEIVMGVYSDLSDFVYHFHINTPDVTQLFAQGVDAEDPAEKDRYRKQLHRQLSELYGTLEQYNFRQLHFHEHDNRSYLRFHRPEKYGDDLTGIRFSVEYVNREKEHIVGFEEGRIFNGYRFVYPVRSSNRHIGSVEVSVSMKTVVDQLGERFNQRTQFIIRKSQVEAKVFDSEKSNYTAWFADDAYLLDKAVSSEYTLRNEVSPDDIARIKRALDNNQGNNQPFCLAIKVRSQRVVMTFLPVMNFKGNNVAYIFTLFDGEELRKLEITFRCIAFLMLMLFILILLFTLYYRFSQKKIQKLATFDYLTDVYVRRAIMNLIEREFDRHQRYQTTFSVIMIDIDHFKHINDSHGHSVGDLVLAGIAEIIKKNIRKTDSLGRYGGEEFIVLLPETNGKNAVLVAEKLRQRVSEFDFHEIGKVTMCLGVAEMSKEMQSADDLIKKADQKLYDAKHNGRNRVES